MENGDLGRMIKVLGDGRKSRNEIRDGRRREIKIALEFEDEEEGL